MVEEGIAVEEEIAVKKITGEDVAVEDVVTPRPARKRSHMLKRSWRGIYVIWLRDFKIFWRDTPRRIGAFIQPLVYLFILGVGLQSAFNVFGGGGTKFVTFMYPGIIGMTVLFTAMFSAISIIYDRQFGFLKEVLAAPIPRTSVAVGKVFGGATMAILQGMILLVLMPVVGGIVISVDKIVIALLIMALISIGMTSLGVAVAAKLKSLEGFPIIMNFLLLPMLFLSGAMFPLQGLPTWLSVLTKMDPLAYGVDALRGVILKGTTIATPMASAGASNMQVQIWPLGLDIAIMLGVTALFTIFAIWRFRSIE